MFFLNGRNFFCNFASHIRDDSSIGIVVRFFIMSTIH